MRTAALLWFALELAHLENWSWDISRVHLQLLGSVEPLLWNLKLKSPVPVVKNKIFYDVSVTYLGDTSGKEGVPTLCVSTVHEHSKDLLQDLFLRVHLIPFLVKGLYTYMYVCVFIYPLVRKMSNGAYFQLPHSEEERMMCVFSFVEWFCFPLSVVIPCREFSASWQCDVLLGSSA